MATANSLRNTLRRLNEQTHRAQENQERSEAEQQQRHRLTKAEHFRRPRTMRSAAGARSERPEQTAYCVRGSVAPGGTRAARPPFFGPSAEHIRRSASLKITSGYCHNDMRKPRHFRERRAAGGARRASASAWRRRLRRRASSAGGRGGGRRLRRRGGGRRRGAAGGSSS